MRELHGDGMKGGIGGEAHNSMDEQVEGVDMPMLGGQSCTEFVLDEGTLKKQQCSKIKMWCWWKRCWKWKGKLQI